MMFIDADAGAPAFNPVTAISWAHCYYTGGTNFQALGLSLGNTVTTWPDEIATNAADLTAGTGTYDPTNSNVNSKPAVAMSGAGGNKRHATTVAAGAQVSLPYSIVVIWYQSTVASPSYYVTDGPNEGNTGNRVLFRITAGPLWSLYQGTDRTGGTPTSGLKAARIHSTSGNDLVTVNASTVISGVNSGDVTWQGVSLSESGVQLPAGSAYAFYGIYPGDITAAGNWSAFQTWVTSEYGVSIS